MAARARGSTVPVESLGREIESAAPASTRKELGAWYTPPVLARGLLARTLENTASSRPRVCDPTMGAGVFLVLALRSLAANAPSRRRRDPSFRRALAEECLFGIDVDPRAVAVARLALWVEIGDPDVDPDDLALHLFCADAIFSARPGEARAPPGATRFESLFPEPLSRGGFDAVVGNPPWDIKKPDSRGFFGAYDESYRSLTRQAALRRQGDVMRIRRDARAAWKEARERARALSGLVRGGVHYRLQGKGDLNAYKLVFERGVDVLRDGGRIGLIVPSGFYADRGASELRRHLIERHSLELVFGFHNRDGIFDIHRSFRFAAVVARKGARTQSIRVALGRDDPSELLGPESRAPRLDVRDLRRISPVCLQLPEMRDRADRDLLLHVHGTGLRVGDRLAGDLRYRREYDLTLDAPRFVERTELLKSGAIFDRLGRARLDGERYLPLLQGAMLRSFDFAAASYEAAGRNTKGRFVYKEGFRGKRVESRLFVRESDARARIGDGLTLRLAFRDVQNATNERTFLAAAVPDFPCGNTLPTLRSEDPVSDLALLALLTSFVVDRVLRLKMSQNHVNRFVLEELPLPGLGTPTVRALAAASASLTLFGPWFAADRRRLREAGISFRVRTGREARRDLRARIDAVVAHAFSLSRRQFQHVLCDCDLPRARLKNPRGLDPKGFWRVDRHLPPGRRHTVKALHAFCDLKRAGGRLDEVVGGFLHA